MMPDVIDVRIANVPCCAKCKEPLKSNNEFTCDEDRRVCGDCREEYLKHIRKFFE